MSKKENASTLYMYVKDYIIKLIVSKNYQANDQLPTEFELMKELNVGRATVRTALAQLEAEGTIYKRQGVGTFVAERSKNYGLEPLISLDFFLKRYNLKSGSKVTTNETITVNDGPLCDGFRRGTKVQHIERMRTAETAVVAIENNYFDTDIYEKLKETDLEASLAHNLLSVIGSPIRQLEHKIVVRYPTGDEARALKIKMSEKVLELTRWIYLEGSDKPVSYINFVIASHVLEFPFLN
jgi:GntR family transcriptional regulator